MQNVLLITGRYQETELGPEVDEVAVGEDGVRLAELVVDKAHNERQVMFSAIANVGYLRRLEIGFLVPSPADAGLHVRRRVTAVCLILCRAFTGRVTERASTEREKPGQSTGVRNHDRKFGSRFIFMMRLAGFIRSNILLTEPVHLKEWHKYNGLDSEARWPKQSRLSGPTSKVQRICGRFTAEEGQSQPLNGGRRRRSDSVSDPKRKKLIPSDIFMIRGGY